MLLRLDLLGLARSGRRGRQQGARCLRSCRPDPSTAQLSVPAPADQNL